MVLVIIAITSLSIAVLSALTGRGNTIAQVDQRLKSLRESVKDANDPVEALLSGILAPPRDLVAALVVIGEPPLNLLDDTTSDVGRLSSLSDEQLTNALRQPITTKSSERIRIVVIALDDDQWLVIGESIGEIDRAFGRQLSINCAIALVVALLGTVIAAAVTRKSLEPLREIVGYSSSIAAGRLDVELPANAKAAEVRELQDSIGSMVQRLRSAAESKSRSESTMREFLADVAHELRTPLTTVRAYAEILAEERHAEVDIRERARNRIAEESKRMSKLIDDLLLLARLTSTPTETREPVDISRIAATHFDDLSVLDPDRKITVDCSEGFIDANPSLLDRLFANLASNVHLHTPREADVHLRCKVDGASVVCVIDDAGPGLDASRLAKLAEGAQRFDPLRSENVRGSGLGLHLVSSIAQAHGGSVSFERSPLGRSPRRGQVADTAC